MTTPPLESYEVTLTTLAYGGTSLGRLPDGRAVFVPLAMPGERVRVRLVEEKRGHARGELLEVLEASPERITPRCVHFGVCGGCHYQHMPYAGQLKAKAEILRDQLVRIGGMQNPPLGEAVGAPDPYYYRNHVQFHLTPEGKLGYHRLRSDEVFAIQECHLPEPALNAVWPQLDFEALPELERIGLRLGAGEEAQLILESSSLQTPELLVEELPLSAVHVSEAGALVLAGSDHVVMEVLGRPFRVSAGSFFQVNTKMAEAMVTHLLEGLARYYPLTPDTVLFDLYCGAGLFSAFLAPHVGRLVGVEAAPSSAGDFEVNLDEFDNVEIYEAPVEAALPAIAARPDVVVVDPPRAGLGLPVVDALLSARPQVIAYISCDPSTLARDGKRLASGGYRLRQATPFDLFPQTFHIESISFWTR